MAPSSLPGESSGYGVFVTRDLRPGESILGAPDGVGIPLMFNHRSSDPNANASKQWRNFFSEYAWARGMPDHVLYDSPPRTLDYQTGLGSLPNHHCVLAHLRASYPDPPYDDSLVQRFRDAAAGAFSYNRGREFFVERELKAGDEIFLNYGLCSPSDRQEGTWTDQLLIKDDFVRAANLVHRARYSGDFNFPQSHGVHNPLAFDSGRGSGNTMSLSMDKHVAILLPKTKAELDAIVAQAGTDHQELVRQLARHSLHRRTPEWIRQHGTCLENLVGRRSTLPQAGFGAFAQRTLQRGDIVTPAPLLQILDREALNVYDGGGNHTGTQLLMNYCFGHNQSTLLFCPNTNAVLVNHCSHRTKECGPQGPNAEYRWASSGWDATTERWLGLTIEDLSQQSGHGLAMEIVATRNIHPGEEVFIDYGLEWERAWARHVASWKPPSPPSSKATWITAKEANDNKGPILADLVTNELRSMAKHPYLFTGCQYWVTTWDQHRTFSKWPVPWQSMTDDEILRYFSDSGEYYLSSNSERRSYSRHRDKSYWPCSVLREEAEGFYTVRIHRPFFAETAAWEVNNVPRLLTNYSRSLIHYFVLPYASDQHLPGSFRHPIGLRDDMLPQQWRNAVA